MERQREFLQDRAWHKAQKRSVETGNPGFDQEASHAREDAQSLGLCFFSALVEQAINQALARNSEALAALGPLVGQVIRLKTHEPYAVVYCQLCERGVRLLLEYDGQVDARVQLPAGRLLACFMQSGRSVFDPNDFEVQVIGDVALVEALNAIVERFGIVALTRQLLVEWLPGSGNLGEDALSWVQDNTPPWLQAWQSMPEVAADLMVEVRHVAQTQAAVLAELQALRQQMSRPVTPHWLHWLGTLLLMAAGFLLLHQ